MPYRKTPLVENQVYHIFSKSIAGFKIFKNKKEFTRFLNLLYFYQFKNLSIRFSWYLDYLKGARKFLHLKNKFQDKNKLVDIICYCLMPTHFHLILKQLKPKGISIFMAKALNSYTRYFNLKFKRKGPLWEGRFKSVLIKNDEQLLHLTRYIHLNPVTAVLVNKPENWEFSSYREYLAVDNKKKQISKFESLIDVNPVSYKKFVENRIDYQRKLAKIKKLILE